MGRSVLKTIVFVVLLSLIWGANFPITKIGINIAGVWIFRAFAALLSLLFIFFFLIFKRLSSAALTPIAYLKLLSLAIPNVFLVPLLNSMALAVTSAHKASLLIYCMPAFTSLITMCMQKKLNSPSVGGTLLVVLGVTCITRVNEIGTGETLILFSAFIWACGAYLSQIIVIEECSLQQQTLWQALFGALLMLTTMCLHKYPENTMQLLQSLTLYDYLLLLLSVFYVGVVTSIGALFIWLSLIEQHHAEFASYTVLLVPLFGIFFAVAITKETIDQLTVLGAFFILMSLFITTILKPTKPR